MLLTLGFVQVWIDKQASANYKSRLCFGLNKQCLTLVLTSTKYSCLPAGRFNQQQPGQTEYYFPTCIKPCSLEHNFIGQLNRVSLGIKDTGKNSF